MAVDSNGNRTPCTIKVKDGTGERTVSGKTTFTPDADGNATITFISGENTSTHIVPVKVAKKNSGVVQIYDFENFFETENVTCVAEQNSVKLNADGDGSAEFIRELLTIYIQLFFSVNAEANNFGTLTLTLTDSMDKSIAISASIYSNGAKLCPVGMNGKKLEKTLSNASFANGKSITFNYSDSRILIDGVTLKYKETLYGEAFNGFPSNKAYLKLSFDEVSGDAGIIVTQVNNQPLKVTLSDTIAPTVLINGYYGRSLVSKGSEITVYSALSGDILEPSCSCLVSVTYNGEDVVSTDGITLNNVSAAREYVFKADQVGEYRITYSAKDSKNTGRSLVIFQVFNLTTPSLSLKSELKRIWEIGTITLPEAVADEGCIKYIMVTDPYGKVIYVKGNSFTASQKGVYVVRYVALDSEGNTATLTYRIGVQ